MTRVRRLLQLTSVLLGTCLAIQAAAQQPFPSRPITLIVPFGAGGSTDVTSRTLAEALSKQLGQPVVVDNKPGGSGAVAIAALMQKPADGYTMMILGSSAISNQYMNAVQYNLQRDFEPLVVHMSYNAGLAVKADAPWKTMKEFIAYAKANPGKVSYSSAAAGTPQHLIMQKLSDKLGLDLIFVPYGDGIKAVAAALGGQVSAVSQATEWKPQVDAGTLRLLVTYGAKRMPQYPEVPTLTELGYDIRSTGFNAIVVRKGTSPEVTGVLSKGLKSIIDDSNSEFVNVVRRYDLVVENLGPSEAAVYINAFDEDTKNALRKKTN